MHYFLLLVLFIPMLYANSVLTIESDKNDYDNFMLSYYVENNTTLDISEIAAKTFTEQTPNKFSLAYVNKPVWLKFTVKNSSQNERFVLSLNESFYEIANLYHYDGGWKVQKNSLYTPLDERPMHSYLLSFPITVPFDEEVTYYLQIKGKYAYFANIELYTQESLPDKIIAGVSSLFLFSFGILFAILLFALFLYIKLRQNIYKYYLGYSIFDLLTLLNLSGMLAYVGLNDYLYRLHFLGIFSIAFFLLFSMEYLEAKRQLPRFYQFSKWLVSSLFIIGICAAIEFSPWNKIMNLMVAVTFIFLTITAIATHRKGSTKGKFYLFAIFIYFSFILLFILVAANVVEYNYITRYGGLVGTVTESILFTLLLADRHSQMQERELAAKNELITLKNQTQTLLEQRVEEKTSDLVQANSKLSSLIEERELLLKELYHRIKNNFHMIIGLLWFEAQQDPNKENIFYQLINRVKSVMSIYDYLYASQNLNSINIKEYPENIIQHTLIAYNSKTIQINYNLEDKILPFDNAASLAIITNEVLTNSLKHNDLNHALHITVHSSSNKENFALIIHDDGKGFEKEKQTKGLGMKIVEQFCDKLTDSHYSFTYDNGVKFELHFTIGADNDA